MRRNRFFGFLFCLVLVGSAGLAFGQSLVTEPPATGSEVVPQATTVAPDVSGAKPEAAEEPFGAGLFKGTAVPPGTGANPQYRLKIGDQVSIRMFGTLQADLIQQIDTQGNVFLPNIGPIRLAGVPAGQLTEYLNQQISSTYSEDVQVYATLMEARNISVFVTGFVERPGRYAGQSSDSVLDFLLRAQGIQPGSGSYRDIVVLRGNQRLASADLYQFLLYGKLPVLEFVEGDTIVVGPQRSVVRGKGTVRNAAIFEFAGKEMTGRELVELARPLPSVSYALVTGTRNQIPFSEYVPINQFATYQLHDQDEVTFTEDASAETITVELEGRFMGPSTYVVDRNVSLMQLLDYVEVDPNLTNVNGVHLRRKSIAEQQHRALQQSLDRLQRSVLTAVVETSGEAAIRGEEARMVMQFVERARTIKPEGVVVLSDGKGPPRDIRLEDGDIIVIPERASTVTISGEVLAPQTVLYDPSLTAADYIKIAGGYTDRGDESRVVVRHPNGATVIERSPAIQPGDEVIVPPEVDFKFFQFVQDLVEIIFRVSAATLLFL